MRVPLTPETRAYLQSISHLPGYEQQLAMKIDGGSEEYPCLTEASLRRDERREACYGIVNGGEREADHQKQQARQAVLAAVRDTTLLTDTERRRILAHLDGWGVRELARDEGVHHRAVQDSLKNALAKLRPSVLTIMREKTKGVPVEVLEQLVEQREKMSGREYVCAPCLRLAMRHRVLIPLTYEVGVDRAELVSKKDWLRSKTHDGDLKRLRCWRARKQYGKEPWGRQSADFVGDHEDEEGRTVPGDDHYCPIGPEWRPAALVF